MALTLENIESAIVAIQEGGQEFSVDGIDYTAANIKSLYEARDRLKSEAARANGSRPILRGMNFSGMGYN